MSNLVEQVREALAAFARTGTEPALIGGLAVAAHQVIRATQDVDFLVEAETADALHEVLLGLGYRCLYRSEDAANYVRGDQGLDFLYAHRPLARRLLAQAQPLQTAMGRLRVISVEGLIAFKLQGHANDPARTRDLDDIRALLQRHRGTLDMDELREYSPCSTARTCSMNCSDEAISGTGTAANCAPLVREAGIPYQPQPARDPLAEWIDLMEAVQALCPVWPVRQQPLRGYCWLL